MDDQLLIAAIFSGLLFGLIFTKWPAEWVFVVAMLVAYFTELVDTSEVLDKASNSGVITLVLLLLVSTGLEKLSWLTRLSHKLIVPSYVGSLLRMGTATAFFSARPNATGKLRAAAALLVMTSVRNNVPKKIPTIAP